MKIKSASLGASTVAAAAVLATLIAPTADAAGAVRGCSNAGGMTTHCQTSGSAQLYTAPNPFIGGSGQSGVYGPFFHQNRGLGGAAAIGAAAGRGGGR